MKAGSKAIYLIKKYEGCQLKAYRCPAGLLTIGFGNTYYEDQSKVKENDVITQKRAEELLMNLLPKYCDSVNKNIKVELIQNQFDALVSHTWNCGGSKTLFSLINNKASDQAIKDFFEKNYIKGGGIILNGLIKRRKEESQIFFMKNDNKIV